MSAETATHHHGKRMTAQDAGAIKNYLKILSDDHRKLRPNVLQRVTGFGPGALASETGIARPMLYRKEIALRPSSDLTRRVILLVIASDLAYELFDRVPEETVKWVSSPNSIFFGASPFEVCMRGEGENVINWLNRHLGQMAGAAY